MLNIQAKRLLVVVLLYLSFPFFSLSSFVHAQVQEIQDFLFEVTVGVRADIGEEEMHADVVDVNIQIPGYYRIIPKVLYNSGDEQKNESFYLTVLSPSGTISTPVDSNAGPYKVVPDDPGPPHAAWRDAGLFYLPGGVNTIKMHHYALIADQYPQFLNGPISGPESVEIVDSLKIISEPRVDGALELRAITPHMETIGGEKRGLAYPGETVGYELIVRNRYLNLIRSAKLYNQLPASLTATQFSYPPKEQNEAEIVWDLPDIASQDSFVISFTAILPEEMPAGLTPLVNEAKLVVPNDIDTTNNYAVSTVYALADSNGKRPDSADLAISLRSITDSIIVVGEDSINVVKPGGNVEYRLIVINHGPDFARDVLVTNILSPFFEVKATSIEPEQISGDTLIWRLESLAPDSGLQILYNGQVSISIPEEDSLLITEAQVIVANDSLLDNNFATDTVRVIIEKPPLQNVDLALDVQATTDTNIVVAGDTVQAVEQGGRYSYRLTVENRGPGTAYDIGVWNIIPDSVSVSEFNLEPTTQKEDTLYWALDSLQAGSSIHIDFNATVADSLPYYPYELVDIGEIVADQDTTDANNRAIVRVYVFERPVVTEQPDVFVYQYAVTDSFAIIGADTLKYAQEGETYTYYIVIGNASSVDAKNVIVKDIFPDSVTVGNFQPDPVSVDQDSIIWSFETLPSDSTQILRFDASIPPLMPIGLNYLVNYVMVSAENEDTTKLANNTSVDIVYNVVIAPPILKPKIEARPPVVDVTDSIHIRVQVPVNTVSWDLWIYLPDGRIDKSFADHFIATTPLEPDVWYEIDEAYTPQRLVSAGREDRLVFEIRTRDVRGNEASAQAVVLVRSSNYLVLDRNVFRPECEAPLRIRFKLSYRRRARLDIYDLSGRHIMKLTEDVYQGGWNTYPWNGMNHNGQKIGSGVYLVTLRAGEFNSWKKFIIVR